MGFSFVSRRKFMKNSLASTSGVFLTERLNLMQKSLSRLPLDPDPQRRIQLGIVGIGNRFRNHIRSLNTLDEEYEVAALCDIRKERLQNGVNECRDNPSAYTDYQELLQHPGLNAVVILTPNYLHAPMSIDALNAGFDVLVEKPMAISVKECNDMNAAAWANNRICMVAEQHRFLTTHRKVKKLLDNGAIGDVRFVCAEVHGTQWRREHYKYLATSGGVLLNLAVHEFDSIHWMLGSKIIRAAGFGGHGYYTDQDTLDHLLVVLDFENGEKFSYDHSRITESGYSQFNIFGTHGRLSYERKGKTILQYNYTIGDRESVTCTTYDISKDFEEGTQAQYREYFRCIRLREKPLTDGKVMVESIRMCLAAQEAARQGRIINVCEISG